MLIKQQSLTLPRNLALGTFGKLPIEFSTKVNLLYLLYSTTQRCCLWHLMKPNCLLKTFLRTLILMTSVFKELKNCEPEFSSTLAELFNKCLKESCFPDCWKVSLVVPVFKVGERSTAMNYNHVSFLSVVSKVREKLVTGLFITQSKVNFFSDFQYDFRSSQSTADLLAVVTDRIAGASNRSGATRAVALHISKAFHKV